MISPKYIDEAHGSKDSNTYPGYLKLGWLKSQAVASTAHNIVATPQTENLLKRNTKDEWDQQRSKFEKEKTKRLLAPKTQKSGSGCDSVGRAVASDTRVPLFESRHQEFFNVYTFLPIVKCIKTRYQIKRGREWPIFVKKEYGEGI